MYVRKGILKPTYLSKSGILLLKKEASTNLKVLYIFRQFLLVSIEKFYSYYNNSFFGSLLVPDDVTMTSSLRDVIISYLGTVITRLYIIKTRKTSAAGSLYDANAE